MLLYMLVVLHVSQEMGHQGYVCPSSSRATGRTSMAGTPAQSSERNSMNRELSALWSRYVGGRSPAAWCSDPLWFRCEQEMAATECRCGLDQCAVNGAPIDLCANWEKAGVRNLFENDWFQGCTATVRRLLSYVQGVSY